MTKIQVTNVVTNSDNIARFSSIYTLNRTDWEQTPLCASPHPSALFVLF